MWLFDLFRKKESVQPEPPNIVDVTEYRRPPVPRQRPFPHTNHRVVPVNARVAALRGLSRNETPHDGLLPGVEFTHRDTETDVLATRVSVMKYTCECCGLTQQFDTAEKASMLGWDTKERFSLPTTCPDCSGIAMLLGQDCPCGHKPH